MLSFCAVLGRSQRWQHSRLDEAKSAWVTDAGTYKFMIGASSRDIRATTELNVNAAEIPVSNALKTVAFAE